MEPPLADRDARRRWLSRFTVEGRVQAPRDGSRYRCPCCGYLTLPERAGFDVCLVCYWGDDGQDDWNSDDVLGGPNAGLSLFEARANFQRFGAITLAFLRDVRPPLGAELG